MRSDGENDWPVHIRMRNPRLSRVGFFSPGERERERENIYSSTRLKATRRINQKTKSCLVRWSRWPALECQCGQKEAKEISFRTRMKETHKNERES